VLDVWQNFGACREPTEPGWFNCWGRLNPKYEKCGEDSERRSSWFQSTAGYVRGHFTPPIEKSAVYHPSGQRVLEYWDNLRNTMDTPMEGQEVRRVPRTPVVSMHEVNLLALRRGILNSRYEGPGEQDLPPFSTKLTGEDSVAHLTYTRSAIRSCCHLPR
jgi:hypothetical protein